MWVSPLVHCNVPRMVYDLTSISQGGGEEFPSAYSRPERYPRDVGRFGRNGKERVKNRIPFYPTQKYPVLPDSENNASQCRKWKENKVKMFKKIQISINLWFRGIANGVWSNGSQEQVFVVVCNLEVIVWSLGEVSRFTRLSRFTQLSPTLS